MPQRDGVAPLLWSVLLVGVLGLCSHVSPSIWCVTSALVLAVVFDPSTGKGNFVISEEGKVLRSSSGNVCCALSMSLSRTDYVRPVVSLRAPLVCLCLGAWAGGGGAAVTSQLFLVWVISHSAFGRRGGGGRSDCYELCFAGLLRVLSFLPLCTTGGV